MKKANKFWLALLLTVLVAALLAVGFTAAAEEPAAYNVGDHIQFGTYPQPRVDETEALADAAAAATWKSYGYYANATDNRYDGSMQPGDWMQFADFFCDGEKYRAVTFTAYRPHPTSALTGAEESVQDDNGYEVDTVYYFKYEPLNWIVLDPATGYIMCEDLIDAQPYQNTFYYEYFVSGTICSELFKDATMSAYASEYSTSSIRAWLNDHFYETAFSEEQKANIQTTELDNTPLRDDFTPLNPTTTNDKIFLLSWQDALNKDYGFPGPPNTSNAPNCCKHMKGTDYADCQGVYYNRSKAAFWWLRTTNSSSEVCGVNSGSEMKNFYGPNVNFGIAPVCCLSALGDNTAVAETLYSEALPAGVIAQGYCGGEGDGTNLTWVLTNDGTLTISGQGAMKHMDTMVILPPWYEYAHDIKELRIDEGVTTIGSCAFCYVQSDEVYLPDGITTIEGYAFAGCSVKSIRIPDSVTSIGDSTFSTSFLTVYFAGTEEQWEQISVDDHNWALERATIYYNVAAWGHYGEPVYILYKDGKLVLTGEGSTPMASPFPRTVNSVEIEDGVTYLATSAFGHQSTLTTAKLGSGLTGLEPLTFWDCTGLTSVTIPASITTIGERAFNGCTALTDIFYGGSEAQWNAMTIGAGNDPLLNAHIHYNATGHTPGETVIENNVPATCTEAGGYDEVVYCTQCTYEFSRTHKTLPAAGHTAPDYTGFCSRCGIYLEGPAPILVDSGVWQGAQWTLYDNGYMEISGDIGSAPASASDKDFNEHINEVISLKITNATMIPDGSFYYWTELRYLNLCEGIKSIGEGAFQVNRLWSIEIPDGVETIGSGAFSYTSIGNVTLPASLTSIGVVVFYCDLYPIHVLCYKGTPEQWNDLHVIPDEDDDSAFTTSHPLIAGRNLQAAYENYRNGHSLHYEPVLECPATCTENGYFSGLIKCCKDDYEGELHGIKPYKPLNHRNAYDVPATEATATEHGHTAGVWCPDCETWLSGGDVIHNHLGAQTVLQAPTETEDGLVDIVCTVCGEHGQYTVSATGPQPGDNGGNDSGGFWAQITSFFRGIVDWFLRLFRWMGK